MISPSWGNPLNDGRQRHIGAWEWISLEPGPMWPMIAYITWASAIPFSRDTTGARFSAQIMKDRRKKK